MVGRFFGLFVLISPLVCNAKSDSGSIIEISLGDFNHTNAGGEPIESFHKLLPNSATTIYLKNILVDVNFVVLQVHSYLQNVTLSYDKIPVLNNSVTGTNLGLLKFRKKEEMLFYLTYNSSSLEVDIMVVVQAYNSNFPIPGGCNLEFPVEISPFLQTTFNDFVTQVDFASAAPPSSVISNLNFTFKKNDECNLKPSPVTHSMYYQYFPERDFTSKTYFKMLSTMLTVGKIKEYGSLAKVKLSSPQTRRLFASYPGTGRIFAVTAEYTNFSISYVPSITYGCNYEGDGTCETLSTTFSKVLCALVLALGLFCCFFGHYFYRIEVFLFGFFISGLLTYILVSVMVGPSMALSASVGIGFFAAGTILLVWGIFQVPPVSLVLATLSLGFLVASAITYPLSDIYLMGYNVNYWGVFVGITAACPILLMFMSHKANIIACSLLGSYAVISCIDVYVGSNLRYVVLSTIRRAVSEKYKTAVVVPPFQIKDALLVIGWVLLSMAGRKIQHILMKSASGQFSGFSNLYLPRNWRQNRRNDSERRPLIRRIKRSQLLRV